MSADTTKKRKTDRGDSQGDNDVKISEGGRTMAAVLAKINDLESRYTSLQNEMNGMKDKCTYLENRCDSLQRSVQILSKESKWEWSVPPIPLSYWLDQGFDEYYIDQINVFLNYIKEYTCQLRSGKADYIHLSFGDESDDTLLQHDDILLPHWRELANALQLYNNPSSLNRFSVYNIQLTSSVIDMLSPALYGNKIEKLILNNNDFVHISEGIKFAVDIMDANPNMKNFSWDYNQLESIENAHLVLDAVINHPSVHRIRLESCLGGTGYEALRYLVASGKSFELIDFDKNDIQTQGGTAIPDYIASNPPLEMLYLSGNKLNDDDVILIARSLQENSNLLELTLEYNNLTDTGAGALSKAVYDPSSLNSISDCNHTCITNINGYVPIGLIDDDDGKVISSPIERRGAKIYRLLSERNEDEDNVQHLNLEFNNEDEKKDNSLKLVPKVLECVQKYHSCTTTSQGYEHPLSIMYEIMRGWKMPELYESRAVIKTVDMATK